MYEIENPLKDVLRYYCHVETYDPVILREVMDKENGPFDKDICNGQLEHAIEFKKITPNLYEQLTDEDFDSQEEVQDRLIEIWQDINGQHFYDKKVKSD
ncbi:hypothetical protein [Motilimonas sp. E26]|uniref:hypothetical protein n=1 Tax=Motilimonas sp. E26 TaxID=2865674 RepID=UPI001E5791A5|nr:hypothetical protein [Motilimonas sp. E26]MCE0559319.1 hypothetical protein [Motilimonas sp. E26]